jgi:hypothetical protein
MFTNHTTVTLFCSKTLGREKLWSKHILADVNFHGADQFLISDKEVKRSDEYIIRVPHSALEKYVDKATYKAMPADEAYNCFTLKKGDYIVKGEVDCDISNSADLIKNYDALEIVSVTENLNASNYSKHIKLVVK